MRRGRGKEKEKGVKFEDDWISRTNGQANVARERGRLTWWTSEESSSGSKRLKEDRTRRRTRCDIAKMDVLNKGLSIKRLDLGCGAVTNHNSERLDHPRHGVGEGRHSQISLNKDG